MDDSVTIFNSPAGAVIDHDELSAEPSTSQTHQNNKPWTIFATLSLIALICTTLILAIQSSALQLLKNDHVFIFPSLVGNFANHFQEYTKGYGLSFPLNLAYYYGIFSLYLKSSAFAHIALFLIHAAGGFALFAFFRKQTNSIFAIIIGCLYISFPFFTEQYGWLGNGGATIASSVIIFQLVLAASKRIPFLAKLVFLFIIQIAAVLTHEVALYTALPIAVTMYNNTNLVFKKLGTFLLLTVPGLIYTYLRSFVYIAHYPGEGINGTFKPWIEGTIWQAILLNVKNLFISLRFLFLEQGPLQVYWTGNAVDGFSVVLGNIILFALFCGSLGILIFTLYRRTVDVPEEEPSLLHNANILTKSPPWVILSLVALIPALIKIPQSIIGFDTLALSFFALLTALLLGLYRINKLFACILGLVLITFSTLSSVNNLELMKKQAISDDRHFIQIVEEVNKIEPGNYNVAIRITETPPSTVTIMTFGEHMRACTTYDWCLLAGLNRRTNRITQAFINNDPVADLPVVTFFYRAESDDLVVQK